LARVVLELQGVRKVANVKNDGTPARDGLLDANSRDKSRFNGSEETVTNGGRNDQDERLQVPFVREQLPRRRVGLRRYESFAHELVRFSPAPNLPPDHAELVVKIVVLDHRSWHAFGAHPSARAEVKALLQNAVITAGYSLVGAGADGPCKEVGDARPAIGLYNQAEEIFLRHLQSLNRLRYLVGVAIGIVLLVAVAFAVGAEVFPDRLGKAVPVDLLPLIIFFAALGSIVSVLLRLSKLDMVKEISRSVLIVSGAGRPLIASAFALVIYIALSNKLIAVSLGDSEASLAGSIGALFDPARANVAQIGGYMVVAFLCGFSERYAADLLERVERPAPRGAPNPSN
jgi:hypothetical protein